MQSVGLYSSGHRGDFNKDNDFGKEFPLVTEVIEFVAREACGANNDGMVIPGDGDGKTKHVCACLVISLLLEGVDKIILSLFISP